MLLFRLDRKAEWHQSLPRLVSARAVASANSLAHLEAVKVAAAITPVPGGVGPVTIALFMANP
ncbi:hypothetical protein FHT76_007448 [Rhizobium sp. BK176]|nr:hypothetical protein [Rhizobium sp. BK181]MBB3545058.1 hypothetical protein [Rhizobium sp. BK399]MCS3743724.1 hypothetical protein [Rhizobium sp. BK661]MCS4095729.1 hypothetical protein [Rhizobium sp. BK176]